MFTKTAIQANQAKTNASHPRFCTPPNRYATNPSSSPPYFAYLAYNALRASENQLSRAPVAHSATPIPMPSSSLTPACGSLSFSFFSAAAIA